MIDKAFILAAGYGTRMQPLTNNIPKPLVEVNGRSLLERILDRLETVGVQDVMINTHYLPDKITAHLAARKTPRLSFSYEEEILDTGGGIKNVIDFFEDKPFYVIAGDAFWEDHAALSMLANQWDETQMDILTLMQPVSSMSLTKGVGDYDLLLKNKNKRSTVQRSLDRTGTHMWTNIRINHPRLLKDTPDGALSFLPLMDKAQEQGRLFALEYKGWHHISTPEDLAAVNEYMRKKDDANR